jgi:hypothetical protein
METVTTVRRQVVLVEESNNSQGGVFLHTLGPLGLSQEVSPELAVQARLTPLPLPLRMFLWPLA